MKTESERIIPDIAFRRAMESERINLGRSYSVKEILGTSAQTVVAEEGKLATVGSWVTVTMRVFVSGEEARMFGTN